VGEKTDGDMRDRQEEYRQEEDRIGRKTDRQTGRKTEWEKTDGDMRDRQEKYRQEEDRIGRKTDRQTDREKDRVGEDRRGHER
jgi:hypothetical protein